MIEGDKHIRATPLHPKIGGKLDGIDLRENISDEVREEIYEHWMRFMVLVFPNQAISDEQHTPESGRTVKFLNGIKNRSK